MATISITLMIITRWAVVGWFASVAANFLPKEQDVLQ
jgi:hypothetical protein